MRFQIIKLIQLKLSLKVLNTYCAVQFSVHKVGLLRLLGPEKSISTVPSIASIDLYNCYVLPINFH